MYNTLNLLNRKINQKVNRINFKFYNNDNHYIFFVHILTLPKPLGYERNLPMKTQNFEETVTGMEPETKYFFMIKAVSESRALVTDEFVISQTTGTIIFPRDFIFDLLFKYY